MVQLNILSNFESLLALTDIEPIHNKSHLIMLSSTIQNVFLKHLYFRVYVTFSSVLCVCTCCGW